MSPDLPVSPLVLMRTALRASPALLRVLLSRGYVLRLGLLAPGHPAWFLRSRIGGGRDACGLARGSADTRGCGTLHGVSATGFAHGGGLMMMIQARASGVKPGCARALGLAAFQSGRAGYANEARTLDN